MVKVSESRNLNYNKQSAFDKLRYILKDFYKTEKAKEEKELLQNHRTKLVISGCNSIGGF
jgi:hypothetical protein